MPENVTEPVNEPVEITREDLGLDHEPVNEIIGRQPNWIVRWGITLVFVSVILILIGTWIIKYPDLVTTRIQITTESPPLDVVARSSGKLIRFDAKEGEIVARGAYLGILESSADPEQMLALRAMLDSLKGVVTGIDLLPREDLEELSGLGEIQLAFSNFYDRYNDVLAYVEQGFAEKKIAAQRAQIARYENLADQLESQKALQERELALARKRLDEKKTLFGKQLISENEVSDQETIVLVKEQSLAAAEGSLINNTIQIGNLESRLVEIELQDREERRALRQSLQSAYKRLASEFAAWEQRYVLEAPQDGRVSLFQFWSPNQYVNAGDVVLTIVPDSNRLKGRVYLPQAGSGKVEIGQTVQIKLDSFPFDEFGIVSGKVDTISPVAKQDQYLVNVALPEGLVTSYGKELDFSFNMGGTAEIITEDLRLIERIFNQLRSILKGGL